VIETKTRTNGKKPKPCGCQEEPEKACTCCQLLCFERPNYFCGHLLTDDDLSLAQKYVIEKNKLYNRYLHGSGVVCGLRLTCDPDCYGYIRIGDGYAIDDCGNDLIVCEARSFDVLHAASEKGYVVRPEPLDPCKPEELPGCEKPQCFYVALCYAEEKAEYTTPFNTGCKSGPSDCEPTRVREKVRVELLDKLPTEHPYLQQLEKKIANCWKVFTDGPFARTMTESLEAAQAVLAGKLEHQRNYYDPFCQLKVYFLRYIQKCPDRYNCGLEEELRKLDCPKDAAGEYARGTRDAWRRLFELVRQYVYDCILGELVFSCPEPCEASCVVIGTVEVRDGRLMQVCNCNRKYVWSFANFYQVLIATVLGGAACSRHRVKPKMMEIDREQRIQWQLEHEDHCCPTFEIDCERFLRIFRQDARAGEYTIRAFSDSAKRVYSAARTAFDFTDPEVFHPGLFAGLNAEDARGLAKDLGTTLLFQRAPGHIGPENPIEAFLSTLLRRPGDPIVAYVDEKGNIISATADDNVKVTFAGSAEKPVFRSREEEVTFIRRQLDDHERDLAALRERIHALTPEDHPPAPPPAPEGPSGPETPTPGEPK
jgi:hypothetical protein